MSNSVFRRSPPLRDVRIRICIRADCVDFFLSAAPKYFIQIFCGTLNIYIRLHMLRMGNIVLVVSRSRIENSQNSGERKILSYRDACSF